jgi:hypothetical protein
MHKKNLHPAAHDFQLKIKKRERRKKKEVGLAGGLGSLTLLDLAVGSRRLAAGTRRSSVCFSGRGSATHDLFVFSGHGSRSTSPSPSLTVALPRHLAATHLATNRRLATETHGWVSPTMSLVFSWF